MSTVIITDDAGVELHRSRVEGVEPKILAMHVMTAIAKIPPPRRTRSDAGVPKGPRKQSLPPAANPPAAPPADPIL